MKARYILPFIAVALLIYGGGVGYTEDASVKAAQKAAELWMPLWDSGKYDESYDELAQSTKEKTPRRQWFVYWSAVRKPLGELKSRKLIAAEHIKSLKGLPDQEGAFLQYESSFKDKEKVVETFGMIREKDGTWRVGHYLTN